MAKQAPYKQYNRNQRRAVLESDLSSGMMSSEGPIEEGYLKSFVNCSYEKETSAITPRPGLRVSNVILPDGATQPADEYLNENITIKDSKQCVEDGTTYHQVIVGKLDDEDPTRGLIWVLTGSAFMEQEPVEFEEDYTAPVTFSDYKASEGLQVCYFYSVQSPSIHNIFLTSDEYRRIEFPVGSFAYGNHYYFFGEDGEGNKGLFRTFFDDSLNPPRYDFESVNPKELMVSEAVSYGYNMMLGDEAYVFNDGHTASVPQLNGILPYDTDGLTLMMAPKQNQNVLFRCYYDIAPSSSYDVVWEWRETTSADWTQIQKSTVNFSSNPQLKCQFQPPAKDLMLRVVLYTPNTDEVAKAIVVGFDFTAANYNNARQLEQKVYDLTTATGMERWNGRLAIWGLPVDPTILFISDYEEPSYFPYPNNIVVFDEPIIYAIEFLDSLVVFTVDKIYQVTTADDGNSWKSTILQSHLSIDPWDKHLIQVVRNMLYFKSGNYYYMMVPKAQSLTGELTLAPITTPITSFFDRFSVNVEKLLRYTYGYTNNYDLITYYNFLDYEDVHNIYAYKFDNSYNSYSILHFDVIYNTVDRTWKVWIYESPNLMYPYKQEATRNGLLATTSLVKYQEDGIEQTGRIIQLFSWDKMIVRSCYVPNGHIVHYDTNDNNTTIEDVLLHLNPDIAHMEGHMLVFDNEDAAYVKDHRLYIRDSESYVVGFSKPDIISTMLEIYNEQENYYTFQNFQFIDTGYRNDELQAKKRYREIQLLLNNLDKKNMQFGMDYILDGAPRRLYYKYNVTQVIDEFDPDYGIVYVDATPYLETELDRIDLTNQWTLDQSLTPEISLWKVRISVSGKGYAPRLRLYSRNEKRFELLSINWVSKIMNMR